MKNKKLISMLVLFILQLSISGCFVAKKITGADINNELFDKARESKIAQIKVQSMTELFGKLSKADVKDNDIYFTMNQDFLNKILKQYDSTSGWFDKNTKYVINNTNIKLENGFAIASVDITANSLNYGVDVDLIADCIFSFETVNQELVLHLEPFNITPKVKTSGLLSSADELIKNLIKVNLADLEKKLPEIKIPLVFNESILFKSNSITVKDKINLTVNISESEINYKISIKDVYCFSGLIYITMYLDFVKVK
jgi:hypothetical protein